MCDPGAIAMSALNVSSQMAQMQAQNQQARAQYREAQKAHQREQEILGRRRAEITEDANTQVMERRRQQLRQEGKLRAAFGDAGVLGNSPLRQLHDAMLQAEYDAGIIGTQKGRQLAQTDDQSQAATSRTKSRINQARASIPSPFLSGLQIGSAGVTGAMQGHQMSKQLGLNKPSTKKTKASDVASHANFGFYF